jgi:hypothetical protein
LKTLNVYMLLTSTGERSASKKNVHGDSERNPPLRIAWLLMKLHRGRRVAIIAVLLGAVVLGPPAIPVAEEALSSPNFPMRMVGMNMLVEIVMKNESAAPAGAPVFLRGLDDQDKPIRIFAALQLSRLVKSSKVELSPEDRKKLEAIAPEGSDPMSLIQEALSGVNFFPGLPGAAGPKR